MTNPNEHLKARRINAWVRAIAADVALLKTNPTADASQKSLNRIVRTEYNAFHAGATNYELSAAGYEVVGSKTENYTA